MSDELKPQQIGVRATPVLWQQVRDAAKANGRSMNAEVISRLERSFLLDDIRSAVREELQGLPTEAFRQIPSWSLSWPLYHGSSSVGYRDGKLVVTSVPR